LKDGNNVKPNYYFYKLTIVPLPKEEEEKEEIIL
jgi:hypothetical protein